MYFYIKPDTYKYLVLYFMNVRKYKILAFLTMMKYHRRNSSIYGWESTVILAKSFGMSFNTFKKYFNLCLSKKYIVKKGNNYQAIGLTKVIKKFKLEHLKFFKHTEYSETPSFKDVYKQIQDSILIKNFTQQDFAIKKDLESLKSYEISLYNRTMSRDQKKSLKRLVKKAGKLRLSTDELVKRMYKNINTIKTGKNHAAKLLGMSTSSGKNILRRLSKDNKIEVKIIQEKIRMDVNHASFEYLKKKHKCVVIPSNGFFWLSIGREVSLDTKYMTDSYNTKESEKNINLSDFNGVVDIIDDVVI